MDTGIRPSELFGLKVEDINFREMQIEIPPEISKTRVSRNLPISAVTAEALRKLISVRHPFWSKNILLFPTEDGFRVTATAWQKRLVKYSEMIGIKITPYQLRHSFATIFLRHGGNPFALQQELGHTTMTMTQRYITLVASDIREQHDFATPLNSLVTVRNRVRKINA